MSHRFSIPERRRFAHCCAASFAAVLVCGALASTSQAAVSGDVDGNGYANAVITSSQTGLSYWRRDSGPNSEMADAVTLGAPTDYPFLGDMDGNGREQVGIFRPAGNLFWYQQDFKAGSSSYVGPALALGGTGDIPLVSDVDGNGIAQVAVYHPTSGTFEWRSDASPGSYSGTYDYWGDAGVPMFGDTDGNGHANPVHFNRWNGTWRWKDDGGPGGVGGSHDKGFGGSLGGDTSDDFDVPLLGDVDGNGRDNMVIYRPTNGTFYWLGDGYPKTDDRLQGWAIPAWSADRWNEYIPLLQDFDGNGRKNVAVYRQRDGIFTWNSDFGPNTFNGSTQLGTGQNNDIPTASTWQARQMGINLTSWRYGAGDGVVNTSYEAETTVNAIRSSTHSQAADIYGRLAAPDSHYVRNWIDLRWPTSRTTGGANWKIDTSDEADKAIETHRALDHAQASTAPSGIWGMTSDETTFVTQRMNATHPSSRAYGGPNWKIDTDAEADTFIEAFRGAASDASAVALYNGVAEADRPFIDGRMRASVPDDSLIYDVTDGQLWYIGQGDRDRVAPQYGPGLAAELGAAVRVSRGVVDSYVFGEEWTDPSIEDVDLTETQDEADSGLSLAWDAEWGEGTELYAEYAQQSVAPLVAVGLCVRFCPLAARTANVVGKLRKVSSASKIPARAIPAARSWAPNPTQLAQAFKNARGSNPGRTLGRNIEKRAKDRPGDAERRAARQRKNGFHAHHIVATGDRRAAFGRAVLQNCGTGPNDPANGVWLNDAQHRGLHTNAYFRNVNEALRPMWKLCDSSSSGTDNRLAMTLALKSIAFALQARQFPH